MLENKNFKICWWLALLIMITTGVFYHDSLRKPSPTTIDIILVIVWLFLVLYPLIKEISFGGIKIKKDIEGFTKEIKREVANLRLDINNKINFNPTININPKEANKQEILKKNKEEAEEEVKKESSNYKGKQKNSGILKLRYSKKAQSKSESEKVKRRIQNTGIIENLAGNYLTAKYNCEYHKYIKLEDQDNPKDKIIFDGMLIDKHKVKKFVEIKYITEKSFDTLRYIISRLVKKAYKLNLHNIPIVVLVVSDDMTKEAAILMKRDLEAYVEPIFFKFEDNIIKKIDSE